MSQGTEFGLTRSEIEVFVIFDFFLSFTFKVCDKIQPPAFKHLSSWGVGRDLREPRDPHHVTSLVWPTQDLVSVSGPNSLGHACVFFLSLITHNQSVRKLCQFYRQKANRIPPLLTIFMVNMLILASSNLCPSSAHVPYSLISTPLPKPSNGPQLTQSENPSS